MFLARCDKRHSIVPTPWLMICVFVCTVAGGSCFRKGDEDLFKRTKERMMERKRRRRREEEGNGEKEGKAGKRHT